MVTSTGKKNSVNIHDYNYQRDIENRLLMAELSLLEVEILQEILHSSLTIPIKSLLRVLDITEKKLIPILEKLSRTNLFKIQKDSLIVNKEMRKYYESQMIKFEENFSPDLEYLQGLLSKVPIHVLPLWYAIPRNSDNIFSSIIEKYFLTPKIYRRYLQDINFEDPILNKIAKELYESSNNIVPSKKLMTKFKLSREKFEEYMLHLEFNFICCLTYKRSDGMWEEVVTPFHEWAEYLRFLKETEPTPIKDTDSIERRHSHDFGFVQDISKIVMAAQENPIAVQLKDKHYTLPQKTIQTLLPHLHSQEIKGYYLKDLMDKTLDLQLCEIKDNKMHATKLAEKWIHKPSQEQAIAVYRSRKAEAQELMRDIREIERSLNRVSHLGWIYFDDFLLGFNSHVGDTHPVSLKSKGKRWSYALPKYTEDQKFLIQTVIFERLFEAGMIAPGIHEGKLCFCVTPFGRMNLLD